MRKFNPIRRFVEWKNDLQRAISDLQTKSNALEVKSNALEVAHSDLARRHESLLGELNELKLLENYRKLMGEISGTVTFLARENRSGVGDFVFDDRFHYARHGDTLLLLRGDAERISAPWIGSLSAVDSVNAITGGEIKHVLVKTLKSDGILETSFDATWLIDLVNRMPEMARFAFETHQQARIAFAPDLFGSEAAKSEHRKAYIDAVRVLSIQPDLIDFVAEGFAARTLPVGSPRSWAITPFDKPELLPPAVPAEPRRRSAVFLHNNYYHFKWLSTALQKRGWDTMTVSIESESSPQQQFYHGEDLNLFDADPTTMRERVREFFRTVPERFGALHFYGAGYGSFFVENIEDDETNMKVPWDLLELRRHAVKIGYMVAGCRDGSLQSSIRAITGGLCEKCAWENNPLVCSDTRNAAWISKLDKICDWVALEGDWTTPERKGPKFVTRPIITTLSEEQWRPDLDVPNDMKIERRRDELLVYHAVGNDDSRRRYGRDIKGTDAVWAAIERLKNEGHLVKLFFATDIPSTDVKFYQVQADIVIDQLNYGRLGANAREALMLGRPVITNINGAQDPPLQHMIEAPVAHADEETIYETLKGLLVDPVRRSELGAAGRAYAIKWHSPDVCAKRYERVIDRLRAGLPAEADEVFELSDEPV